MHRQEYISIPGTKVNMTEYLFSNNLTANFSELVYRPGNISVNERRPTRTPPGLGELTPSEGTIFVTDTMYLEWISFNNALVARAAQPRASRTTWGACLHLA